MPSALTDMPEPADVAADGIASAGPLVSALVGLTPAGAGGAVAVQAAMSLAELLVRALGPSRGPALMTNLRDQVADILSTVEPERRVVALARLFELRPDLLARTSPILPPVAQGDDGFYDDLEDTPADGPPALLSDLDTGLGPPDEAGEM